MKNQTFLNMDLIQKDLAVRKEFLSSAEEMLANSSFQQACEAARSRLDLIPGDIDAAMILGRALLGLGRSDAAFEIFSSIRRNLDRWASMLDLLEDPLQGRVASAAGPPTPSAKGPEAFPSPHPAPHSPADSGVSRPIESKESGASDKVLHNDFYTMTMAELFLKQGHFEMAKQVLEGILKANPNDLSVLARLHELKKGLSKEDITTTGRQAAAKLERWLAKLRQDL